MSKEVNWKFSIAQYEVAAGARVQVVDRWIDSAGIHLILGDKEKASATFILKHIVNVGGKNYLLLNASAVSDELVIVREAGRDAVSAIDVDRLSSLRNALDYFFELGKELELKEVESIFGVLPERQNQS